MIGLVKKMIMNHIVSWSIVLGTGVHTLVLFMIIIGWLGGAMLVHEVTYRLEVVNT